MKSDGKIRWLEWGPQAFERARAADRPILLDISAVWCHWCHVMDDTTYADPRVIELIEERFVPIRVDNDRRPDINVRYNMGGWPTTAFLTPSGEVLTGATYVPPDEFADMLQRVSQAWTEERGEIERRIGERRAAIAGRRTAPAADLDPHTVETIVQAIAAGYDEVYGGFGTAPKFPQTDALRFLLLVYRRDRARGKTDERLYEMLARTALAMARNGMYDRVEGGFFRYSTTRDWSIPHFEKMAEDHAGLLRFYADLYRVSGNEQFAQTLRSALRWLREVLRNAGTPFFGGSQDADEDYYALPLDERRAREAPFVDRTVYANWNAELAAALVAASVALDDETLLADARATVSALWETMRDQSSGLVLHFLPQGGKPQHGPLLTDHVALLDALLEVHAATGEARFLHDARTLCDLTLAAFRDQGGACVDARAGDALGHLDVVHHPLDDNALLADVLLRLSAIFREDGYRNVAHQILLALGDGWQRAGSFAAPYGAAVLRALEEPLTIAVVAEPEAAENLRDAALRFPDPLAVAYAVVPEDAGKHGYLSAEEPLAYVCSGTRCAAPARDAATLQESYDALRRLPVR